MHESEYSLEDPVRIAANGKDGTVKGIYSDAGGFQYSVQYCDDNGLVSDRYFRGSDLSRA